MARPARRTKALIKTQRRTIKQKRIDRRIPLMGESRAPKLTPAPTVPFQLMAMVSTYNCAGFIENRIRNLLDSTIPDLLIYVTEANSPEREARLVNQVFAEYMTEDPRQEKGGHKIYCDRTKERIGLYATWNRMMSTWQTPYVATCNCDDIISPVYFEKAIKKIEEGFDMTFCDWFVTTKANQKWPPKNTDGVSRPKSRTTCGHFPVWRYDLHLRFGLFDEQFLISGDAEWWRRMRHYGGKDEKIDGVHGCWLNRGRDNLYNAVDDKGRKIHQREEQTWRSIKY